MNLQGWSFKFKISGKIINILKNVQISFKILVYHASPNSFKLNLKLCISTIQRTKMNVGYVCHTTAPSLWNFCGRYQFKPWVLISWVNDFTIDKKKLFIYSLLNCSCYYFLSIKLFFFHLFWNFSIWKEYREYQIMYQTPYCIIRTLLQH